MATRADQRGWRKDGSTSFYGGMDGGRFPSDIDRDQVSYAENCTMRGGTLKPRPGWRKRPLSFTQPTNVTTHVSSPSTTTTTADVTLPTDTTTSFALHVADASKLANGLPIDTTANYQQAITADSMGKTLTIADTSNLLQGMTITAINTAFLSQTLTVTAVLSATQFTVDADVTATAANSRIAYQSAIRLVVSSAAASPPLFERTSAGLAGVIVNGATLNIGALVPAMGSTVTLPIVNPVGLSLSLPFIDVLDPVTKQLQATLVMTAFNAISGHGVPYSITLKSTIPPGSQPSTVIAALSILSFFSPASTIPDAQTIFETGRFQDAGFYDGNGVPSLISVHSGRIMQTDLQSFSVKDITPSMTFEVPLLADFTIGDSTMQVEDTSRMSLDFTALQAQPAGIKFTTQADFTLPAKGATANLNVDSTTGLANTMQPFTVNPKITGSAYVTDVVSMPAQASTQVILPLNDASQMSVNYPDFTIDEIVPDAHITSSSYAAPFTTYTCSDTGLDSVFHEGDEIVLFNAAGQQVQAFGITVYSVSSNQIVIWADVPNGAGGVILKAPGGVWPVTTVPMKISSITGNLVRAHRVTDGSAGMIRIDTGLVYTSSVASKLLITEVVDGTNLTVQNVDGPENSVLPALTQITVYPQVVNLILTGITDSTHITVDNVDGTVGQVILSGTELAFTALDVNVPDADRNWCLQAEQFFLIQDNSSLPLIYDGSTIKRSSLVKNQVPTGNIMCYAQGRIAVALPDRTTYRVGDIIFGSSGTAAYGGKDGILYFTENSYLNEGGDFSARVFGAPSDSGNILAMKANAQTDTQLGQGPMIVGTPNVVFTANLPFDRTVWKNMANALQTANPIIGPVGNDCTVLVNTDLWYRSQDGWRTYIQAQRQFNGSPGNAPVSTELDDLITNDTPSLLEHCSAVLFDNRLLGTYDPQQSPQGVYFSGLAVMDFYLANGLRKKAPPAWEGAWTGLNILKILTGTVNKQKRCFMFVLNSTGHPNSPSSTNTVELWELSTADKSDYLNGVTPTDIDWNFELCSYNCNDSDCYKNLETGRILVGNISGVVTCSVTYRTDTNDGWLPWTLSPITITVPDATCIPTSQSSCIAFPTQLPAQSRHPVRLPRPPDGMALPSGNGNQNWAGYEFQPRFEMTGYCEIHQFRLYCKEMPEMLGLDMQPQT